MAAPEPKQNTPKTLAEIAVMYNVTEKEIVEYSAEDLQELLTDEFSLDPGVAESITSEVQEKGGNLVYVDPQYTRSPAGAVMDYITLEEENAKRRAAWEAAFGKDYGVDTGGGRPPPKKQEGAGRKKRKSTKRRKSKKRKSKKRKSNKRKTKRKKRSKRH